MKGSSKLIRKPKFLTFKENKLTTSIRHIKFFHISDGVILLWEIYIKVVIGNVQNALHKSSFFKVKFQELSKYPAIGKGLA